MSGPYLHAEVLSPDVESFVNERANEGYALLSLDKLRQVAPNFGGHVLYSVLMVRADGGAAEPERPAPMSMS